LQVTATGISVGYTVEFQSSTDGGTTWSEVASVVADSGSKTVEVPLAGYGVSTQYRARTSTVIDTITVWSDWVVSSAIASTDTNSYLVSTDGVTYLPVEVREDSTQTIVQGVAVTYGHGSTRARQDQTIPMGLSGQTILIVGSLAEQQAVEEWLTTEEVWWLRWGPERTPGTGLVDHPATKMALAGPVGTSRVIQAAAAARTVAFSWIEQ
jgi:hypothetical protein